MPATPRNDESDHFTLLRIKRALAALGLDVREASPATLRDLYERLHPIMEEDQVEAS